MAEDMMENGNGSAGRFLRIETKLDRLSDVVTEHHVDVVSRLTIIETTAREADKIAVAAAKREYKTHYLAWLKVSVIATFVISLIGLIIGLTHLHVG